MVLVAACLLAGLYTRAFSAGNKDTHGNLDRATLEQLERMIATGTAPPQAWAAYGQRLYDTRQYARSALAYRRVIEAEPYNRPARFQCALALAAANDADGLLAYLRGQLYVEPKLVAELLDHSALKRIQADARFAILKKEARAQAMD